MCGIVGAVSDRNIVPILVQGLQRLEYRGYDSCGVAIHEASLKHGQGGLKRARSTSRVSELMSQIETDHLASGTGIAHTRWATHGAPAVHNAHPHFSSGPGTLASLANKPGRVALVHNGIIENHDELRAQLQAKGYVFTSQTDTEVISHWVDSVYDGDLFDAVKRTVLELKGAYAIAVFHKDEPQRVVGARAGSPLILGVGTSHHENFLASDAMALAGITDQIVYLEEGDLVDIQLGKYWIEDRHHQRVERPVKTVHAHSGAAELGPYRHYMQKEIFEQPRAIADTLEGVEHIVPELFDGVSGGANSASAFQVFKDIDNVLILACGTSYYSGCVAKYWLESVAKIPCQVEIASEYRYRDSVPNPKTLVVTITQSGETADTLAALRHAQSLGMHHTLTICNVATSAMVRECKLKDMRHLPAALQAVLALEPQIISWSQEFASKENALFLGRGTHYPIALEGALKLKEITYIHAEAYAAGELKHGPLALVTSEMPVVTVAPNDALLEKLKSNMQEVRARGGVLYVLADGDTKIESSEGVNVIRMPEHYGVLSPILHVVPLQLLAYHTACARGTDVDKPRNLAKSVTVE
ncbi:MAG: glutamine--fructose-6-phosphate transaminase (isomerizing) [Comamonadaceae bacterium]|nr:glutamine--fructose-6-phosphate transaminase (isomerizing) [Comamonadaceae bacterium]